MLSLDSRWMHMHLVQPILKILKYKNIYSREEIKEESNYTSESKGASRLHKWDYKQRGLNKVDQVLMRQFRSQPTEGTPLSNQHHVQDKKTTERAMRNLSGTRGSYIARNLPRQPYFLIWESAIFSCNLDALAPLSTWSHTRQQLLLATVPIHFCRQSCQILFSPVLQARGLSCTQVTRQSAQPVSTQTEPPAQQFAQLPEPEFIH